MTTAVTLERSTAVAPSRGPRGLVWATLRLHRWALWFWVLLVAVGAGALLWAYGPGADAAWSEYRTMGCETNDPNPGCDFTAPAYSMYDNAVGIGTGLLALAPFLTATWAGAALIGRELESGTAQLTWVQSVSPARWLTAKLAVPAVLLGSGTLLVTLLHRLVWSGNDGPLRVGMGSRGWYEGNTFVANGTLATAYALLGLAVGVLAGLLQRRALPALGLAFFGLMLLTFTIGVLRPRLWPVDTITRKTEWPPDSGMVVDEGAVTSTGAHVPNPYCATADTQCLVKHDIVGYYRDFHPSSHFWPLQLVETGIVLAVAAVAVLIAFRLLKRRTGAAV